MEAVLHSHGQALALQLHAFLRDADRARKREFFKSAHDRLDAIGHAAAEFLGAAESMAINANDALTAKVVALRSAIAAAPAPGSARAELDALISKLRAGYEELAATLRAAKVEVPQLRPANYTRNLFHVGSASFSAGLIFTFREATWVLMLIAGTFAVMSWTLETLRRTRPELNDRLMGLFKHVSHPHEAHQINSSTWYATALLGLSLTANPLIMMVGVLVLGFADPAAAIIGRRFGRLKLVNGRTLEGTMAFVLVGGATSFAILSSLGRFVDPTLSLGAWAALTFGGALAGGLAELFSKRIDDNLSIPWAAAFGAWLVLLLLG